MPCFKMNRVLTAILLFMGFNSFGEVRVDTLFVVLSNKPPLVHSTLKFPVIKTGDQKVDELINKDLKNRFTDNEYPNLSTDSTLLKWADDIITSLDFDVTLNKNGLISLKIGAEGCGAYCTNWSKYFTYSTTTGKPLSINEVVDTAGRFKSMVVADKNKQYEKQRKTLKDMLTTKDSGLDEDTYQWALEQYNECAESFALQDFALYPNHLEIIAHCYLPNAIKNLAPVIELKYSYTNIRAYLKIEN